MKYLLICLLAGCLVTPALCSATPPLSDTLIVGEHDGVFYPEKCCWENAPRKEIFRAAYDKEFENCCWVDLPRTEKFRAAYKIAFENPCSAVGGIVGRFRLADDKIWLVGLHRCGGDIPLEEIYPELGNPAFASWLNGVFFAKINWSSKTCNPVTEAPIGMYYTTLRLKIENGIVTDMQRQENKAPDCQDIESRKVIPPYDQWRGASP